jgi:hypothetical protein
VITQLVEVAQHRVVAAAVRAVARDDLMAGAAQFSRQH